MSKTELPQMDISQWLQSFMRKLVKVHLSYEWSQSDLVYNVDVEPPSLLEYNPDLPEQHYKGVVEYWHW